MGFSANPGGPVWSRYSGTVLIDLELVWFGFFTFNLHILRRPFSDAGNWLRKRKKPSFPHKEERLIIGSWKSAPFLKMKKPGFLWLHATKIPAGFQMIIFRKLYIKLAFLFNFPLRSKKALLNLWLNMADTVQKMHHSVFASMELQKIVFTFYLWFPN